MYILRVLEACGLARAEELARSTFVNLILILQSSGTIRPSVTAAQR